MPCTQCSKLLRLLTQYSVKTPQHSVGCSAALTSFNTTIGFCSCRQNLTLLLRLLQDYPEHRLQFFSLLRAITNHCFGTLFTMSPDQLKLVIDSIVWAFRHTERNIAETGNVHAQHF